MALRLKILGSQATEESKGIVSTDPGSTRVDYSNADNSGGIDYITGPYMQTDVRIYAGGRGATTTRLFDKNNVLIKTWHQVGVVSLIATTEASALTSGGNGYRLNNVDFATGRVELELSGALQTAKGYASIFGQSSFESYVSGFGVMTYSIPIAIETI